MRNDAIAARLADASQALLALVRRFRRGPLRCVCVLAIGLGQAHRDKLLRKKDVAGATLGKDECRHPVEAARFRRVNQEPALYEIGDRLIALRSVAADCEITRPRFGIEFGERDLHAVYNCDDLPCRRRRMTGGKEHGGRCWQCRGPVYVPSSCAREPSSEPSIGSAMETAYDWITISIFAGLVTLFLARSTSDSDQEDNMWHYLPPSAGCGVANWLGNEGHGWAAALLIAGSLSYAFHFLHRPSSPSH